MNDASRVKREKPNQPSNNKNDGQNVKYTSHISLLLKIQASMPGI
jgi:hypothetical protein